MCTRELSRYMTNNVPTFHHTDSVFVMAIAILSLYNELLTDYRMPNTFIDMMSSNDTLHTTFFHLLPPAIRSIGRRAGY